ncbi:hypothetical protein QUB56_14275 [Microcoleus sp. AR_TQ3_B6]|uniref:hypothetical protein n=1 Tax=Microcoleus sp. AR_TQ3_B6 TaxID=3055284 RepID=UPI002FD4D5F0
MAKIEDTAVPFPYSDRSLDGCTRPTWNLLYKAVNCRGGFTNHLSENEYFCQPAPPNEK